MIPAAIDRWLPRYQVSASYSIQVRASAERTYAALAQANFSNLALVRGLMRLRGYGSHHRKVQESEARHSVSGAFLELEATPPREIVLGIAGRFWRPDGGLVRSLKPDQFADFHCAGFAKGAWSFSLAPAEGGTRLSTETRVQTFGWSATLKFRAYWLLVGPFSGLIRKAMLREVRRVAEEPAA